MEAVKNIKKMVKPRKSVSSRLSSERASSQKDLPDRRDRKRPLDTHTEERPKRPRSPEENVEQSSKESSDQHMSSILTKQMEIFNDLIKVSVDTNQTLKELTLKMSSHSQPRPDLNESFGSKRESDSEITPEQDFFTPTRKRSRECESQDRESTLRASIADAQRELAHYYQYRLKEEVAYDFEPEIIEKDAKLSKADPFLQKQGAHCQKLGTNGWENIRYAEVQKDFQATPTFCALKKKRSLTGTAESWKTEIIKPSFVFAQKSLQDHNTSSSSDEEDLSSVSIRQ